jgi:hypothetical protein
MPKLHINRYLQDVGQCAIASSSTLGNFFNPDIDYNLCKKMIYKITKNPSDGLDSGEIGLFLNFLGFKSVNIISSDLHMFDYSWTKLKKENLIETLKKASKKNKTAYKIALKSIIKWIDSKEFNNKLVIDYKFGDYIKKEIDKGIPLIVTFNWTLFFKMTKMDPFSEEWEEHAVVAYGYDKKGVFICDSHHEHYKYKLKRFREGLYHMNWETLMSVIGFGDVITVADYDYEIFKNNFEKIN